jgi:hypothetical protein
MYAMSDYSTQRADRIRMLLGYADGRFRPFPAALWSRGTRPEADPQPSTWERLFNAPKRSSTELDCCCPPEAALTGAGPNCGLARPRIG